jgi:hypothetical protein
MKREAIICAFWLLLSFYLSVESYRLGLSTANRPGPGFFPFLATIGIGLTAVSRLINSIRQQPAQGFPAMGIAGEARLVLWVIVGMVVYVFLLDHLGFLLCTFLLVAFYLKAIAGRRWTVTLAFAAAVALVAHYFFDVLLHAGLPRGLLTRFL